MLATALLKPKEHIERGQTENGQHFYLKHKTVKDIKLTNRTVTTSTEWSNITMALPLSNVIHMLH